MTWLWCNLTHGLTSDNLINYYSAAFVACSVTECCASAEASPAQRYILSAVLKWRSELLSQHHRSHKEVPRRLFLCVIITLLNTFISESSSRGLNRPSCLEPIKDWCLLLSPKSECKHIDNVMTLLKPHNIGTHLKGIDTSFQVAPLLLKSFHFWVSYITFWNFLKIPSVSLY
jgi:hypothetical protein